MYNYKLTIQYDGTRYSGWQDSGEPQARPFKESWRP